MEEIKKIVLEQIAEIVHLYSKGTIFNGLSDNDRQASKDIYRIFEKSGLINK